MISDLIVGTVWRHDQTGEIHTVIHVATAGCGDSVAWEDSSGKEGGGSAIEFFNSHTLIEKRSFETNP